MELTGKRFLAIGGAGLIGSHTVDELLKEDVKEICSVCYRLLLHGRHIECIALAIAVEWQAHRGS